MLVELIVKEFLDKVVGSDFVFGGGSVVVFNGVVVLVLIVMVVGFIIGKKGYEEYEELMKYIFCLSIWQQEFFVEYIDCDFEVYDYVFGCFKLFKFIDEEKVVCSVVIQEVICFVVFVLMQVVCNVCELMEIIVDVVCLGNQNVIMDVCVVMMVVCLVVLGVLLNVCINLGLFKDKIFVDELKWEVDYLE